MKNSDFTAIITSQIDDSSARATTVVTQKVTEAYREVLQRTFKFLLPTTTTDRTATPETALYSPASEYYEMKSIFYKPEGGSSFSRLEQITEEEYEDRYINASSGTPSFWFPSGVSSYTLVVTPSDAGTIREVAHNVQNDLSGAQDSIIPSRFNNVILEGALAKYKVYEGLPEASIHQGNFEYQLDNMIKELVAQYPTIQPTFYK